MSADAEDPFVLLLEQTLLRGRIDAVYVGSDGHDFQVVDWKTANQPSDPTQLAIYRLAWAQAQGVDPARVDAVFYHVLSGEVERTYRLLREEGYAAQMEHHSPTSQYGQLSRAREYDHLDVAALQKIVALRQVIIISNREVATELKAHGLTVQIHEEGRLDLGVFQLLALSVQHEAILDSPLPQMTAWLVNGKVLNPADSFANNLLPFAGVEMLLLPVTAPFLTELVVADFALKMRPRQILPVHDGYLKPFFIQQRYENYGPYFEKHGIVFHRLAEPGDAITLP